MTPVRNLSAGSRRTLAALASVVTPGPTRGGAPAVPIDEIVDFIDDWVRYLPRLFRLLFPVGLLLLEYGALVLTPSLRRFSALDDEAKGRYVEGWVHARARLRRDLIKATKGLCLLAYYSDARVTAALGYTVDEHVKLVSSERLVRHGHDLQ
jgi:hypothetical protein